MTASPASEVGWSGKIDGTSSPTIEWINSKIMLQTVASFAEGLYVSRPDDTPEPSGTVSFRHNPDTVRHRVATAEFLKVRRRNCYGVTERHTCGPDRYANRIGAADERKVSKMSAAGRSDTYPANAIDTPMVETDTDVFDGRTEQRWPVLHALPAEAVRASSFARQLRRWARLHIPSNL